MYTQGEGKHMSKNTLSNNLGIPVKDPVDPLTLIDLPFDHECTNILELARKISSKVSEEEWNALPTDLARNHNDYQKNES